MRALNDLGILSKVYVVSTVSGGSVIGCLYAYGAHASFEDFDSQVVNLLRIGLQARILRSALFTSQLPRIVSTVLVHTIVRALSFAMRSTFSLIRFLSGWSPRGLLHWLEELQEQLPIWGSLTTAFEKSLEGLYPRGTKLRDVRIPGLEMIINTCDLRTGTAFRFGSKYAGCWRYGRVVDGELTSVAKAVASSAAFPLLLPPIVQEFEFEQKGVRARHIVALTDGGVYDNLGVSAIEPGKNLSFSLGTHNPTHIISLSAGAGQFATGPKSFWLLGRLVKSFDAVFRKAQDAVYARLHMLAESRRIRGFALIYLGQKDETLPAPPPDLVSRERVRSYPTDFAPMKDTDIESLTKRGEQLTRLLISRYLPDI